MYIGIDEVRKIASNASNVKDYIKTLRTDQPTIVLRDYNEPKTFPFLEKNVHVLDIQKEKTSSKEVLSYGVKPNVPTANVINAIKNRSWPWWLASLDIR